MRLSLGVSVLAMVLAACTTPVVPGPDEIEIIPPPEPPPVVTIEVPFEPHASSRWLPQALLVRLPEPYREVLQPVELSAAEQAEAAAITNDEALFGELAQAAAERVAGVADKLVALYTTEPSPSLKRRIVAALPLRGANATPAARQLVMSVASGDPDIAQSLAAAARLDEAATDDIVALLRRRVQAAESSGDAAGGRRLRDAVDYYQFQDITLPKYAYKAPPIFAAAPANAQMVRVLAFGDFGTGSPGQIDTANAMRDFDARTPFTFGITLGDNFYSQGLDDPEHARWKTQWEDLYTPMGVKFYPTYGNHDVHRDSPAAQLDRSALSKSWAFPAPFYTYTAGGAQFFAIDSMRMTDDQLDWLDAALKASTAKWKIVYGHHQIFSATRGDSGLVNRLLPVLVRNKVDAYLCGHDHNLQELKPEESVHFFVLGAGGAGLYDFDQIDEKGAYERSIFRAKEHGFGMVEVTPAALTISVVALDGRTLHSRKVVK